MAHVNATFEIVKHNLVGYINPDDCPYERFKPWIRFLNEHSLISSAVSLEALLKIGPLRVMYTTSVVSNDLTSFSFMFNGSQHVVNKSTLSNVLDFPTEDFEPLPTEAELTQFFTGIHYHGVVDLKSLSKKNLMQEWDAFFDTISKVFVNSQRGNFHLLTSTLQQIGYAVAHNRKIDFA